MQDRDMMTALEIQTDWSAEFRRLLRFTLAHLGGFTLGLVRVNDPRRRDSLVAELDRALAAEDAQLVRVDLSNRHPANLRQAVLSDSEARAALQRPARVALAIVGMEHLIEAEAGPSGRPPFAAALNAERDLLPAALPCPLLVFLTDHAMDRLDMAAPDFFDWYSGVFRFRAPHPVLHADMPPSGPGGSISPPQPAPLQPETLAERLELLEERRSELERVGPEAWPRLGQVLKELGELYAGLQEFHKRQAAITSLRQAAEIYRKVGQKGEEAAALEKLGEVCYWIHDYPQALRRYKAAEACYRELGDRLGEANCIQSLGDVHRLRDEYTEARTRYEAALALYRELGDRLGEATCIQSLGDVHGMRGEYTEARTRYEAALALYRELGNRLGEANCIKRLGDVYHLRGEYTEARTRYEAALALYRELGVRWGEANCLEGLEAIKS